MIRSGVIFLCLHLQIQKFQALAFVRTRNFTCTRRKLVKLVDLHDVQSMTFGSRNFAEARRNSHISEMGGVQIESDVGTLNTP